MRRIRPMIFVAMLGLAAPVVAEGDGQGHGKAAATTKRARPHKPVSAAHKKALAKLYDGFKFGMTKDEVIAVFSQQLDDGYDERINATTDITAQDRLRRDRKNEINRLQSSYVSFEGTKPSPWDVSIVEDQFAHNTGEAMLERWDNEVGKNQRRFFFFFQGKLWKMFVSLDVSILPEDKKNFPSFQAVMESQYGPGDVDDGVIAWHTDEFEARAVDKLKSYDALGLVIEDSHVRKQVDAMREAKAPPRRETNSVIKAVIDADHTDHPNTKANSDAVESVIRAQGGTPKSGN